MLRSWNRGRRKPDGRLSGSDRDTEQTCNECGLPKDVILRQPPDLSLANHVHRLDTLNRSLRRVKRSEALTRSHPAFDCPMILLHHIVEIANGSTAATPAEFSCPFEFIDYLRISRIAVYVDNSWPRMVWRSQGSLKEAFGSTCIALRREQKVNGVTRRIHRPI